MAVRGKRDSGGLGSGVGMGMEVGTSQGRRWVFAPVCLLWLDSVISLTPLRSADTAASVMTTLISHVGKQVIFVIFGYSG